MLEDSRAPLLLTRAHPKRRISPQGLVIEVEVSDHLDHFSRHPELEISPLVMGAELQII